MTVCVVTDRRQLSPDARTARDEVMALTRWLEDAVPAGIDLIQLRERDLPARLLAEAARAVRRLAEGSSTRVVVNDRADVAVAAGCDGVHLRGDGPDVARMRALAPEGRRNGSWMVGRSVHSGSEARTHGEAHYLLFGAVFPSGPKPGRGLEALRDVVASTPAPVLAIGGLTAARAAACVAAGAAGVAAIGLFLPPGRAAGALGLAAGAAAIRRAIDRAANGYHT
jgi:thiamine-phosphate pyrophosphorylase